MPRCHKPDDGARRDVRHKTRHRGITYRERADGERTYFVYAEGRQVAIKGGEREALAVQARFRSRLARGERVSNGNVPFEVVAEEWFAQKTKLRARTRVGYRAALDNHLLPFFGGRKIGRITYEDVAEFIVTMEKKRPITKRNPDARLHGWTIQGALTPLGGIMRYAVRKGHIAANPVELLEKEERPQKVERDTRILDRGEIEKLVASADEKYRPIIFTAVFTGLRLGELLGLRWRDVDLTGGVLRVRRQVTPTGEVVEKTKTAAGRREVWLADDVARTLAEVWAASDYSGDDDCVFASLTGTPLQGRNVLRRGLDPAAEKAGVTGEPKLRFHDLRHTYASMLIDSGCTPADVCAQMGHANPSITLERYTHLFSKADARARVVAAIAPNVASLWQVEGGNGRKNRVEEPAGNGSAKPKAEHAGINGNGRVVFPS